MAVRREIARDAKPTTGTIPLTGKAAEWFANYVEETEPDPKAQAEQLRADIQRLAGARKRLQHK